MAATEPVGGGGRDHLDAATFQRFRDLIYRQSGIALQENKEALVAARVAKRMRRLNMTSFDAYLQYVTRDESGEEMVHLLDAISTNVTSFFRESAHFDLLTDLIGQWLGQGRNRLRVWSAACSSGEEPYTIAMTLDRAIGNQAVDWKILATDISTRVLQRAQEGIYDHERVSRIPPEFRQRYFATVGEGRDRQWQVVPELRERVVFRRINLSTPPFPLKGGLDAVFCRNVMIYFDQPTRSRLVNEIHRVLRPGGFLFVGHAESLTGVNAPLRSVQPSVYTRG